MTRYVRVPARLLHRIPDSVSYEDVGMTEPCAVLAHAVFELSHIKPGDTVVIFGSGPVGLLCYQMARLCHPRWAALVALSTDGMRL